MPLTTNTERRLIGDFRFSDNQLQRVMLEIRHAIHQLQGLNGAEGGTLTRAEIVQLINNLLVGITVDVEEAPVDGTPYSRQDADWVNALQDAPSNGSEYVRKDGQWVANTGGTGSGIPDAPSDGTLYGRKDAAWEAVPDVPTDIGDLTDNGGLLGSGGIPEAPIDGTDYVRKDGAWSSAAYFSGDYGDLTNQPDIPSDVGDLTDNGNLLGGGGGGATAIDDLTDVDTSTNPPGTGQVLKWDGTNWVPGTDEGSNTGTILIRIDAEGSGDVPGSLNATNMTSTYPSTDAYFGSGGATFLRSNQDWLQGTWLETIRTNRWTFSFWIKTSDTDYSTNTGRRIIAPQAGTNFADGFQIYRNSAAGDVFTPYTDNLPGAITLIPGGSKETYLCSTRTVETGDGNWHYIVMQHEGSGVYSCFVDGALTERRTASTGPVDFKDYSGFFIGKRSDNNADAYFTGSIDNLVLTLNSAMWLGSTTDVPTSPNPQPPLVGAEHKWIDYATGFSSLPSLLETIAAGDVYEYTYSNGTLYRLVATDGSDKFFSSFSSPTLSGLVSEKAITI